MKIKGILFSTNPSRWWAGAGWVPALLVGERKAWTDESGSISLPPKDLYQLPAVEDFEDLDHGDGSTPHGYFEWVDPNWKLDYDWTAVDPEGWEYYNNQWTNARPSRIMGSFTRRRKWVRNMRLVQYGEETIPEQPKDLDIHEKQN